MQFTDYKVKNNLFLAPMAGICDVAFRVLCKRYGAGFVYSEFVNVEGITRNIENTMKMLQTVEEERPVGIQIFGTNLDSIAKSCQLLQGKADLIDFNVGCPVYKVTCTGAGGALLTHPERLGKIVKTMKQNSKVPITVKIRRVDTYENTIKIAKEIEKNGAAAIAIHGRTVPQGYTGQADWSYIKAVKEAVNIPVLGNGDIRTRQDYLDMIKQTGCDAVLIGRAAMTNPGIFEEILENKSPNKFKMFFEYADLADKFNISTVKKLKIMAQHITKGIEGASKIRESLNTIHTTEGILEVMENAKKDLSL
jgi:tRNA-dihydrouridine synthase B